MSATTAALPLDTVTLWVTNTIERDYEARGVFPTIRQHAAHCVSSSTSLHLMTADQAAELMEDAVELARGATTMSLRKAYTAQTKNCSYEIKIASEREAAFTNPQGHCARNCAAAEYWWGRKSTLQAKGVVLTGAWPGEPGGKKWSMGKDWRGFKASVTRYSDIWPDLYEVYIKFPHGAIARPVSQSDLEEVRQQIRAMPASAHAFRVEVVQSIRRLVAFGLEFALKADDRHGYTLEADAVGEIHAAFDAVAEAILAAPVNFDAKRHAAIERQLRAQLATADTAFQRQLSGLLRVAGGGQR